MLWSERARWSRATFLTAPPCRPFRRPRRDAARGRFESADRGPTPAQALGRGYLRWMAGTSCMSCGSENPPEARFCMSCGSALERSCPSCGASTPEGARFCMACGSKLTRAPAPPGPEERPPEERRQVTVLFADLSGYTGVAERMDPEAVKSLVERSLHRLGSEVERFGGTVDKYIGDNVMAVFGAPLAHEDDEERAVRAALGMQAAME